MSEHVLPDSRLTQRPDLGCQMVDWPIVGGKTVRLEAQPIYCANCGIMYGWVPKDNTIFECWVCRKCFEKCGLIMGTYAVPEDEFNKAVAYEMEKRFGRHLSDLELFHQAEKGILGRELELLEKESPYPIPGG